MNTHANKTQDSKSQSVAGEGFQKMESERSIIPFLDERPEAIGQRRLKELADNSSRVKQFRLFRDMANNSVPLRQLKAYHERPVQRKEVFGSPVVQRMYKGAKKHIAMVLERIAPKSNNNNDSNSDSEDEYDHRAKKIVRLSSLDDVTEAQIIYVWNLASDEVVAGILQKALQEGDEAFAEAMLVLISKQPLENDSNNKNIDKPDFKTIIKMAVEKHAPPVGKLIDEARDRASESDKKLLIVVGEKHNDAYGQVMTVILMGALKRLDIHRYYMEATPDDVKNHVEKYKQPENEDNELTPHYHFYHNLYEQEAEIEGVDIEKNSFAEEKKKLGDKTEDERNDFWKRNVETRNKAIAETITRNPQSGVMVIGLNHLPGLVGNDLIRERYEIVTISTLLPDEIRAHFELFKKDSHESLLSIEGLYFGGIDEEVPKENGINSYKVAENMITELNKIQ